MEPVDEPIPERIILPVNEHAVEVALAKLKERKGSPFARHLCEIISALWRQNCDQAMFIEGQRGTVNEFRKQLRQEKLF